MGKETTATESSVAGTATKKRRFPIPFRKKTKSASASEDENNHTNNNNKGTTTRDAPLNGSGVIGSTTSTSAIESSKDTANKAVPPKVTIVEPSRSAAAAANLPRPPSSPQLVVGQRSPTIKTSWLCRTKFFQRMCDWAFSVVDQDGSGNVDEKELYSGLLLIHLKLGSYAGPAACKPLELDKVRSIFKTFDVDRSGSLDKNEFREVMMVLFGNVLLRVLVQWSMTLLIVPLVAKKALDGVYWLWGLLWQFIADLDNDNAFVNSLEMLLEETRDAVWEKTPPLVQSGITTVSSWIAAVPDSVWNTVPLTLLSCILGIVVVPYMIFSIDDYFQKLANRKSAKIQSRSAADKKNN